jgi:hypothetical protein
MIALQFLTTIALIVGFLVKLFRLFVDTHALLFPVLDLCDRSSLYIPVAYSTWSMFSGRPVIDFLPSQTRAYNYEPAAEKIDQTTSGHMQEKGNSL